MLSRANLLKILSALVLCGAWEIAGRVPVSYAFPTFLASMQAFFEMIGNGMMLAAYKETLRPLVIGIMISAVLGIGLGLWVGLNNFFDWLFFMACQSSDLFLELMKQSSIVDIQEYVSHIETLGDALTFGGTITLFLFNVGLLSLALNVFIRHRELSQIFDRLRHTIQLSAQEKIDFETKHLNQIFVDDDISIHYQEKTNQLTNRQYIFTEFLQLFPRKRFMYQLQDLMIKVDV